MENDYLVNIYKMYYTNQNQVTRTEKIGEKHPVFKDKSDDIKKVVIVIRGRMRNFICTIIFHKFCCIL